MIFILMYHTCILAYRCVAQLGRALRSGRRGRGFESRRIDEKNRTSTKVDALFLFIDVYDIEFT